MRSGEEQDEERDRLAIEQIRGHVLPQDWPPDAIAAGTRVRVVQDDTWAGPWRREFLGVISSMGAPERVRHRGAMPGEYTYWVTFDQPESDADGDGPYRKAQIWGRYLRIVAKHADIDC